MPSVFSRSATRTASPRGAAPRAEHPTSSGLSARALRKSFGGREVLRGIDLEIDAGDHVAIIGPSGSGKSTLIRCLNLLEVPDAGTISINDEPFFDDRPTGKVAVRQVRLQIGMVFQAFNLFPTHTALENVAMPQRHALGRTRDESEARALDLLRSVGLHDHVTKHPSQLSGGQQQRVAIARALALDPQVMLFDEPTSAIDPEMRVEVLRVMRDLSEGGMTMVTVTHELGFAKNAADRVMFIADGQTVEQGTPAEIFGDPRSERLRRFVDAVGGAI